MIMYLAFLFENVHTTYSGDGTFKTDCISIKSWGKGLTLKICQSIQCRRVLIFLKFRSTKVCIICLTSAGSGVKILWYLRFPPTHISDNLCQIEINLSQYAMDIAVFPHVR